jgi:hypothetical protein
MIYLINQFQFGWDFIDLSMHLKIRKYSKLSNLALASAAIASSMLIADVAQAETPTVTKDQNESSLVVQKTHGSLKMRQW